MTITYDEDPSTFIISNLVIDGETKDLSSFSEPYVISEVASDGIVIGDLSDDSKSEAFGSNVTATSEYDSSETIEAETTTDSPEPWHPWWWGYWGITN